MFYDLTLDTAHILCDQEQLDPKVLSSRFIQHKSRTSRLLDLDLVPSASESELGPARSIQILWIPRFVDLAIIIR